MPIRLSCPKSQGLFMGVLLDPDTCPIVLAHLREAERVQEVNFRVKNTQKFKETYGSLSLPSLWEIILGGIPRQRRVLSNASIYDYINAWNNANNALISFNEHFHEYEYGRWSYRTNERHSGLSKKDVRIQTKRMNRMGR